MSEFPNLFQPKVGMTYKNHGGGEYRCLWSNDSEAGFINTSSKWRLTAHGCRMYKDGTIEWDYSTGGYFE